MFKVSKMKVSELAKFTGTSIPLVSRHFKDFDETHVTRVNNRIIGISPDAVEVYLKNVGINYFYRPAILLSANLCGGVGKTTSIYNLGASLRRIVGKNSPIVYVDGDSQGSFTSLVFGKPANDNELILIDFLEGKATIDNILTSVGDNVWFVKSNLNQAFIDKVLSKPQDIKKGMLRFYESVFEKLGKDTKIFQDHTPQISNLFASSVCALNQLDTSILKCILIPIRSDNFAIQGADYILREILDLTETFSLKDTIDIHCFFSSIDKRVSTTAEALKITGSKEKIMKNLSPVVIRYCSEITKTIMNSTNVFSSGKNNNAAEDYQDLLQYIFSCGQGKSN
ncbi:MAG: AAA family ATPase [Chlamydiae bacterium]|nr:AAA family ATPase [Chlamydiota bacterium]